MSQFLGRQDCIESLQKDIADLQCAIVDAFSTTGPVHVFSWKFPDKLSYNLDLDMEQYSFLDGEDEFNQHVHIVLLELVIDRLLLLVQASNAYVEERSNNNRNQQTDQKGCTSIGLVVKKYWRNLLQFSNMKKENKLQTEMSNCAECVPSMRAHDISASTNASFLPDEDGPTPQCHSQPSSATPNLPCNPKVGTHNVYSQTDSLPCNPKVGTHNVSSQTDDTPAAPCSVCHQTQSTIRKTGNVLVELLQREGLPSSLHPLLDAVQDSVMGEMRAGDAAQWASEQLSDMRRLSKHVQDVRNTVEPLKKKLTAAEADRDKLRGDMEGAQKELKEKVEKQNSIILQLEGASQKAQTARKETEQRLSDEYEQLKREHASLKRSYSDLTGKVAIAQDRLQDLEYQRNELQEKLKTLHIKEKACANLQERIQQFESQLCEAHLLLEKEKAKYDSACHHQESMETKQKSLLQRVEALDEECEELQKQLGEREERELNLHNQLQQMSEDNEQLRTQFTSQRDTCSQLQSEKQTLQTQIEYFQGSVAELKQSVKSLKETERLLVAFPELSPLAHAQPKSTGNVLLDMEQQLQANSIRIGVLEKENAALQGSLVKLKEAAQQNAAKSTTNEQESSPLQICSFSPVTPPVEQLADQTQMQMSPFRQNCKAPWLGNSDRVIPVERDWASASAADRMPPTCVTPSSSTTISLQTLHFNISSTAAKIQTRNTRKTSYLPQTRSLKQRKKVNH
ncbi:coiled-coil domain-containing protein 157 isoform X2 [Hippocampus comes]|uniref:coiled-coil domain-containing protein 157 isoform X2 n=1 Tax=Hippocampus comes TaxID=109280 RepID=UPI00094EE83A|nr:PREDICTED: coiled-coil domain-containing protein 157 isoform X2 [Hippocampus comes]